MIAEVPIGQAPQAIAYVSNAVPEGDGAGGLQPLGLAGQATHLTLVAANGGNGEAPTSVSLFDQGLLQILEASVTGLEPRKPYVLALSDRADGGGAVEALASFVTNPAGSAIVNAAGPIRQIVRSDAELHAATLRSSRARQPNSARRYKSRQSSESPPRQRSELHQGRIRMDRRAFVRLFAAAGAAGPMFQRAADAQPAPKVRNVVLVHGLFADGSCWSEVIPRLQAAGVNATSVQNPLTTLDESVASAQRALALQDGPTVLVGHSFSGMIVTEAGIDPKVSALVYVAARAPDAGEDYTALARGFRLRRPRRASSGPAIKGA